MSIKKFFRTILIVLGVIVLIGAAALISLVCWVKYAGSPIPVVDELTSAFERGDEQTTDDGTPIVVNGAGRREGVFTMCIAATDEEEIRTDSIMVMTFDTVNHTAQVLNIPRDTLVDTRRTGAGKKINAAYGDGPEEMLDDISGVVGFRPDKYLVANFDGIAAIVDQLGGVDYEVPFDMSYHDESQDLSIEFEKGMQHMNGKQVVEFLRWRHNDDGEGYVNGDVGRVEKLQKFLVTLAKKVMTPANIIKIPALASTVFDNVKTDLTSAQILWLGMQALQVDMDKGVNMETLAGDEAIVSMGSNIWFFIVDEELAIAQVNRMINPYEYALTEDVFNIMTPTRLGCRSSNWEAERGYRYSFYQQSDAVEDMEKQLKSARDKALHTVQSTVDMTWSCSERQLPNHSE